MFSADDLRASLAELTPAAARGYVVALSGGADSLALAAAAAALRASQVTLPLRAVHVNHGLQSAAENFSAVCERACAALGLPLQLLTLAPAATAGYSLEEWAREARYAALAANLQPDECLLTAHQREDQAETFLLQALRGAGLAGLAAMPARARFGAGWHLRPLLGVARQALKQYVAARGLDSVEDVMNADLRFDRAYLRDAVWPTLVRRWPGAAEVLVRSAAHVADGWGELRAEIARDLARARDGDALSLTELRHLSDARRREVLRAFIESRGVRAPPRARLLEALRQMQEARADAAPLVCWDGQALRRYRSRLYLTAARLPVLRATSWDWHESPGVELGEGLGRLRLVSRPGALDAARLAYPLRIDVRYGAETLRIERGGHARALRHLLQSAGVVPWWRDSLPLLYSGDALIAVADMWRAAEYCVTPEQDGLAPQWQHGPALY